MDKIYVVALECGGAASCAVLTILFNKLKYWSDTEKQSEISQLHYVW